MNHHQSKMNFAVRKKARGFASMGAGFVDQMETKKMEERLQLMKKTMEQEREERKNRGGQFWKSGQKGKLTTYANAVLQSKLSNQKVGKVKMLVEEPLNIPVRNDSTSLSKKLSDISNNSTGNMKPSPKNNVRLCGQCESNGAALCCIQCTEVYCTACFSAYHKKGALRKHRSISLEVSSTPRSKPPSHDKRSFDLARYSMAADAASQQSDSPSPSGASGAFKRDEEDAAMPSLMDGNYNEAESAASFQEALLAWRTSSQPSSAAGAAAVAPTGDATSVANTMEISSSQPKPKKNEGIDSSTSTMGTATLASLMSKNQNHTLSYAEQLLVKRNRRTPICWETNHSESKGNSGQMKTEETSIVLDSTEILERLGADEPVTFSSLYCLVAQETNESDRFSSLEDEISTITPENVQNELILKPEVPKSPTEDLSQNSVRAIVESFPEKRPSSSASQSDEKIRIKSTSSDQSGKRTPTSQVQSARKHKDKSKKSAGVSQTTNLTTVPSEGLQMVCGLAKSQHKHNDGQQSSLLLAGLSSDATGDADGINLSETDSLLKSSTKATRPATAVRVSYTLYKMSPRSWHPEESISLSFSEKSTLGRNDASSNPTSVGVQRASTFDSPPNAVKTISSIPDKTAMMEDAKGDKQASGTPTAKSSNNQDLERSSSTFGDTAETPQEMELDQVSAYFNNNAISQHAEKYDPISPNSQKEEAVSPNLIRSTLPVYSRRSKTMSPIATTHTTNKDHTGRPIYSARGPPRNKSAPPDCTKEKQKDGCGIPVYSRKHFPRSRTISPIPSEIDSDENISPVLSLEASAMSLNSGKDTPKDNSESPIPTIIDAPKNLFDTPVLSVRNTPRSNTMSSIPTITERQLDHSVTPTCSIKSTPRSKTMSTIHLRQETHKKRCDTPEYSEKGTPRYKSMSPIPSVLKTRVKSSDTPSLTKIDTKENVSGTHVFSSKNLPRSISASPISNIQENICETPADSLSCKTASTITSILEFQENGSATSLFSVKGTPRNKTESPIPTIIETRESASDTSIKSSPMSPIPTTEKRLSYSVTPVPSARGTPRTQRSDVNITTSQTRSSPTSNREDKNKEQTFQYNAKVYQMLVNKEVNIDTPDPQDHIIPPLPTATDQSKYTINLEEVSETTSATETDLTSSDCIPILSESITPQSLSPTCSSESDTPIDPEEKLLLNTKLATPFYMCNSELYDTDSPVQGLDSVPVHARSQLKKSSTPTKKYIIRRPPEIPDRTRQQESNPSRDDDLQPKSASSTLSVLEMKRIHFKQSNNGQNVVSLEGKPNNEQSNLDESKSSPSQNENADGSADDDPDSVFSSLTKMSVDSLDAGPSQSLTFNGDEFLMSDDLEAEINEMEQQIAEEIKVKALK